MRPTRSSSLNGHIIDGTGSPWYSGDIGIRDGKIVAIANLSGAPTKRTIDAHGLVVAPGFIDMLGQSELTILVDPRLPSKIYQGITTEITGEGSSVAPLNDAVIKAESDQYHHLNIQPDWRTLREYFARLEKQGIGINLASYVGATQVRSLVIGFEDKQPTSSQLDEMKKLVREAMQDGAVGVSTSLEYTPAPYAKTEELIALASEAAKFGGIYATHMRSEGDAIMQSLDETVRIGREASIPVEIWHLKTAGKTNWGHMPEISPKSTRPARRASTLPPTPTPTPPGTTACPPSFLRGPMMAAMPNSSSVSKIPPRASAFAKNFSPRQPRGTTNGRRFPGLKP